MQVTFKQAKEEDNPMQRKHSVRINVSRGKEKQHVLTSRRARIMARIGRILFGDYSEVLILQPGKSVQGIEIHELGEIDHEN